MSGYGVRYLNAERLRQLATGVRSDPIAAVVRPTRRANSATSQSRMIRWRVLFVCPVDRVTGRFLLHYNWIDANSQDTTVIMLRRIEVRALLYANI